MSELALFLFRRDLRLDDNTGLLFALSESKQVIPAFIFTPEQIENNPYRSDHCLRFMMESLEDLASQLKKKGGKLFFFYGTPEKILEQCLQKLPIDTVVVNRDYTPYSVQRDQKLSQICKKHKAAFHSFDDLLLLPPEATLKKDGKPYTIFTPYFRNASKQKIPSPVPNRHTNYFNKKIAFAKEPRALWKEIEPKQASFFPGGRAEALKLLKKLLKHYDKDRDFPAIDATSHLSAYLKFTVSSPREIYWAIHKHFSAHHPLIRSLFWRDFFTGIGLFFPRVFKGAFQEKFSKIPWRNHKKDFERWCSGMTGFPIVDAGMREMNATGFMHNRVRMIAASFLVKDLHIDWRWGEKYFAQTLIDYDPAVNNGNWQWVASTGCDAQPYFRIFNPWSQQKKFDPDCLYIKKWIPELKKFSPQEIHQREEESENYPAPMVDHDTEAKKLLSILRKIRA